MGEGKPGKRLTERTWVRHNKGMTRLCGITACPNPLHDEVADTFGGTVMVAVPLNKRGTQILHARIEVCGTHKDLLSPSVPAEDPWFAAV